MTASSRCLVGQGLLRRLDPLDDHQFFQLDAACLLWRLRRRQRRRRWTRFMPAAPGADGYAETPPPVNAFFQRFYRDSAAPSPRSKPANTPPRS